MHSNQQAALSHDQLQRIIASQGQQTAQSNIAAVAPSLVALLETSHAITGALHSAVSALEERIADITEPLPQSATQDAKNMSLPRALESLTVHNGHLNDLLNRVQSLGARVRI